MPTKHLRITGRVQGVFFRGAMTREARSLGVTGWVCNRADGSVEAVVQGEPEAVERIVAWAHRGPERARVEKVEVSDAEGEFADFRTLATY